MIKILEVNCKDKEFIEIISDWYFNEWKIAKEVTIKNLSSLPENVVRYQIVLFLNDIPVCTGGLYLKVGIQDKLDQYKNISPWIGLMYTKPEYRGNGYASMILDNIEKYCFNNGYNDIFLFTYTAENLYLKHNWISISRHDLNEKKVVVMQKSASGTL